MFRDLNSRNVIVGLILLVMLLTIAGPTRLPQYLADVIPVIDEGAPCAWLPTPDNLANHQSLIGRTAPNPIAVEVRPSRLPPLSDASGDWMIDIIVINTSLGTVPFVYSPDEVLYQDNNTSGLGLIFNYDPAGSVGVGGTRQDVSPVPLDNLRVLGPRQRCVHTVVIPAGNALVEPSLRGGTASVRAYYRNSLNGQITSSLTPQATPIFNDQGLWTGFVQSGAVSIPAPSQ